MFWQIANLYFCSVGNVLLFGCNSNTSQSFQTDYFGINVDSHGYITGMYNLTRESRNFSPADQSSPLLALQEGSVSIKVFAND